VLASNVVGGVHFVVVFASAVVVDIARIRLAVVVVAVAVVAVYASLRKLCMRRGRTVT
jgi:hypothetical protein